MKPKRDNRMRLLISCPDRPGIVAEVSRFLYERGANILESDQYSTDPAGGTFFIRIEFEIEDGQAIENDFENVAEKFFMKWRFSFVRNRKRMAVFVSKFEHCLLELLWRWQAGDIDVEIPLVISNHPDHQKTVEALNIPFYCIPVKKETKYTSEQRQLALLKEHDVDFVVLARYMQILSPEFVAEYPYNIINIHHSFLPAFIGAKPYERAYERGVKIIGATSHYVTEALDKGPIIEQGVKDVSHRHNVQELKRIGRTIERDVLARAVSLHVEDRVIVHGNKTVVF